MKSVDSVNDWKLFFELAMRSFNLRFSILSVALTTAVIAFFASIAFDSKRRGKTPDAYLDLTAPPFVQEQEDVSGGRENALPHTLIVTGEDKTLIELSNHLADEFEYYYGDRVTKISIISIDSKSLHEPITLKAEWTSSPDGNVHPLEMSLKRLSSCSYTGTLPEFAGFPEREFTIDFTIANELSN